MSHDSDQPPLRGCSARRLLEPNELVRPVRYARHRRGGESGRAGRWTRVDSAPRPPRAWAGPVKEV